MKMFLIFIALLGIAATALAQSSVTLFGVVDAMPTYGPVPIADHTQMLRGGFKPGRDPAGWSG